MKIGLPKALLYYYYENLLKAFFDNLNIKYIESNDTTLKTLKEGQNMSIDESCLALKIYLGHIKELQSKCDAVLVPRIFSLTKDEQVCTNFNCLYDLVKNTYQNINLIDFNIDVKNHHTEKLAFLTLGQKLGKSLIESNKAYTLAKKYEQKQEQALELDGKKALKSKKEKILIIAHPYIIKDNLIGKPIITYLKKNNIEPIYSYYIPKHLINFNCNEISPKIHFTMNKPHLAAFNHYKDKVKGTIILSAFPCGPDSLSNEMIIRKRKKHPVLLLTLEDLNSNTALITRLESFLDMLKGGISL